MPLPGWLEPMAATLTDERFTDPSWTFERKLDGIRLLAYKDGPRVRLWSRNRLSLNESYPDVVRAIAALGVRDAVFDGEATGAWGRQGDADYHVFDLLWLNGRRLTSLPLDERRRLLSKIPFRSPIAVVKPLTGDAPWERACREGWEGVIAKRRDAPYDAGRSRNWLKMKCEATQELVIGGFTDPQGARVGLGALLVGYFEGPDFVFAGKVGTGFNTALLTDLRAATGCPRAAQPAVHAGRGPAKNSGSLGPSRDRGPGGVHRVDRPRQASPPAIAWRSFRQVRARGRAGAPVITHPDKVLFPDDGITKGELAEYYDAIAPVMLPHLRGRPITMERFPSGIGAEGFLQKDVVKGFPSWLKRIEAPKKGGTVHYALAGDRALAGVAGEPEHDRHSRLAVARASP